MTKRIRLGPTIKLQTTVTDLYLTNEKAAMVPKSRGRQYETGYVVIDRPVMVAILADYTTMLRSLKKLGVFFERELHYSESAEWKASIGKPVKDSEVLKFLQPPKKNRVKL